MTFPAGRTGFEPNHAETVPCEVPSREASPA